MTTSPLDNPQKIRRIDKSNMLSFSLEAAKHYRDAARIAETINIPHAEPANVIIAGMGGSVIGGELLKDYVRETVKFPVDISRDYHLPAYALSNSLVVLASYSGETEETLSAFADALKRECKILIISSGGALINYAKKLNLPFLQVPGGMPPRAALPYMLMPMLNLMQKLGAAPGLSKDFSEAANLLQDVSLENAVGKPTGENPAKKLAINLNGVSPVVYGSGVYRSVALRFKQQFNENSKVPAKCETFSELNHNETMGWEKPGELARCYGVVFLRDEAEPVEIRSRIETTKSLMQTNLSKTFEVWARGKSNLAKMLSTILVGDFASVYLAVLRNVDPTPVDTIAVMKQRIEQNRVKQKTLATLERLTKHN